MIMVEVDSPHDTTSAVSRSYCQKNILNETSDTNDPAGDKSPKKGRWTIYEVRQEAIIG